MHRISVEKEDEPVVVRAQGELDAFAAPDVADAFAEISKSSRVVADLEAVTFLDSTALGTVVRGVKELEANGGAVRVVLPRGAARRIFEITTLDRVLPVSASSAQAVAELRDS